MFIFPLKALTSALALAAMLVTAPSVANAAQGDCSQPVTSGDGPTASDCLFILGVAVGSRTCTPNECVCAPKGTLPTTATDALTCLKNAVGQPQPLNCPTSCNGTQCMTGEILGCPGELNTCTSALFVSAAGSDLDTGWNGLAHNQDLVVGASITLRSLRRCVDEPATTCLVDSDCPSGTCRPFCDCNVPGNTQCEITGPTVQPRCVRDLRPCETNADCSGSQCQRFFGPPLPLTAQNTPACVTTFFAEDLTGTADAATGEGRATAFLRSRVHLGETRDKPCPRCGSPAQNPQLGGTFTCDAGPRNGQSCTVDAVSDIFGGVSNDCPPQITNNISGEGLAIRFLNVTTGSDSKTAQIPCLASGMCTDDGSSCTTNADCQRCDNNLAACTTNADCAGGTCAAAPEQPVSCGFYCHCGFCNNDALKPCFDDGECGEGETCQAGNSTVGTQDQPNGCASPNFLCGIGEDERCCTQGDANCANPTARTGECSLKRYVFCRTDSDCTADNAGTCLLERNPCFEHTIAREGTPSPLGAHCVDDPEVGECTSNADCGVGQCVDDTSEPVTVALFCVPKTASPAINTAGGIPGPGAITFRGTVFACRCGDGTAGCDEECDDGNNANGDGCDQACRCEAGSSLPACQ